MPSGVRARVGDYRLHQARDLPDVVSMHCNFYFSFNYHQKGTRIHLY